MLKTKFLKLILSLLFIPACSYFNVTLNTSFNPSGSQPGTLTKSIYANNLSSIESLAIQSDGKIVGAGTTRENDTGDYLFAFLRFNTNGSLDTTFNSSGETPGIFTTIIADTPNINTATSMKIQPDGKIIAAGRHWAGLDQFGFARVTADGQRDTSFNPSGTLPGTLFTTIDGLSDHASFAYALGLQNDGKIVAAGEVRTATSPYIYNVGLARLNSDGSLDTTFNPSGSQPGTLTTTFNNYSQENKAYGLTIQNDGKIVITGSCYTGTSISLAFARFNTDGSLDTSFNPSGDQPGTAIFTFGGVTTIGYGLITQSDNKIVATGYITLDTLKIFIIRLNEDGSIDTTFNSSGTIPGLNYTNIDGYIGSSTGTSIVQKNDSKFLIGGYADVSGVYQFALAQFNNDGTLDTTFNAEGIEPGTISTTINNLNLPSQAKSIAITNTGLIYMGGFTETVYPTDFVLSMASFTTEPLTPTYPTIDSFSLKLIQKYNGLV